MDVYLEHGSFELLVEGDTWKFYADTPGTRFVLHNDAGGAPSGVKTASQKLGRVATSEVSADLSEISAPVGSSKLSHTFGNSSGVEDSAIQAAVKVAKTPVKGMQLEQVMIDGTVRPLTATMNNGRSIWVFPQNAALVQTVQ
jgi:hypothetical protein